MGLFDTGKVLSDTTIDQQPIISLLALRFKRGGLYHVGPHYGCVWALLVENANPLGQRPVINEESVLDIRRWPKMCI